MQTICILKGFHRRAVTLLRFSRNGKLLATIGHDMHHRQGDDEDDDTAVLGAASLLQSSTSLSSVFLTASWPAPTRV